MRPLDFGDSRGDIRNLLHEKDHLGQWMDTVPAPTAHDPNGEPAKEQTAAEKKK